MARFLLWSTVCQASIKAEKTVASSASLLLASEWSLLYLCPLWGGGELHLREKLKISKLVEIN